MPIAKNLTGSGDSPQQAANTVGDVTNNIAAAGSAQGSAAPVFSAVNVVRSGSGGVILRADLGAGDEQEVANYSGGTINVYPPVGGSIQNGGVNTAFSLTNNTSVRCRCIDGLNFTAVS